MFLTIKDIVIKYKIGKIFFILIAMVIACKGLDFISKTIESKAIVLHVPLHATSYNISLEEENMMYKDLNTAEIINPLIWIKVSIFFLLMVYVFLNEVFICFVALVMVLFSLVFMGEYLNKQRILEYFTHNQQQSLRFSKEIKYLARNLMNIENLKNVNNSLIQRNQYNWAIANIEDYLKKEKSYFKNYVMAQVLLHLSEEDCRAKSYVKLTADYFSSTPIDKLDFTPKQEVVTAINQRAKLNSNQAH